ncbi:MAG: hypothetical protein ACR2K2_05345 [Mycobacteriales bacterium]
MRLALLYARSRGLPIAGLLVAGLSIAGAWSATWLVTRPWLDPQTARLPVTVVAALAVAIVLAGTLRTAAHEVEASAPRAWAGWRTAHAGGLALLTVGLLAPSLPLADYGAQSLLRNTVGLLGLALLTAAAIGPALAWTLPLGYTAAIYLGAVRLQTPGQSWWAFLLQPADDPAASLTAGALLVAGTLAWALLSQPALTREVRAA